MRTFESYSIKNELVGIILLVTILASAAGFALTISYEINSAFSAKLAPDLSEKETRFYPKYPS